MNEGTFQMIQLDQLKANPLNPRKNFSGKKFDDLVESIRTKGVLEPILVRPQKKKKEKIPYEIIAGERRFRASCEVANANGGLSAHTIPAIIREMSDDEAFDAMTIENLQREDLSEMEEARSYELYIQRHGDEAIPDLAQRCGIHPGYIKRRLQVLKLPAKVLKSWEKGKIKFGHCEQLSRLPNEKLVLEFFDSIFTSYYDSGPEAIPVSRLRFKINSRTLKMSCAKFDKGECANCPKNSDVQKGIFEEVAGLDKACCFDPECFTGKQMSWLVANWNNYGKAHKTNGVRFEHTLNWSDHHDFEEWGAHPVEKCFSCESFVSIVNIEGKLHKKQSCVGSKACYDMVRRTAEAIEKTKSKAKGGKEPEADVPRVEWHGDYFREVFFHKRIPEVLQEIPASDDKVLKLILASMFHGFHFLKEEFAEKHGVKAERYCLFNNEKLWPKIEKMGTAELQEALKEAATSVMLEGQVHGGGYGSKGRRLVATHLEIDLQKEWLIHAEYLDKKTIKEILSFGKKLGIFEDENAKKHLEKIGRKAFEKCSKKELVEIILKSGADLAGKVPQEILA